MHGVFYEENAIGVSHEELGKAYSDVIAAREGAEALLAEAIADDELPAGLFEHLKISGQTPHALTKPMLRLAMNAAGKAPLGPAHSELCRKLLVEALGKAPCQELLAPRSE